MVHYRRRFLLERLALLRPAVVVEVGCGSELLYEFWLQEGGRAECWVIVEPAGRFAEAALASNLPNLSVVSEFFENAVPQVRALLPRPPDLVICSGLLHEVPSATALLSSMASVMGEGTRLHVNVPNAGSLHRRLAKSMGLIADTQEMSARNFSLLQHRVFNMGTLQADLAVAGMRVIDEGGYLVKPFTHAQMEQVSPLLGGGVLDGLFILVARCRSWPAKFSLKWCEKLVTDFSLTPYREDHRDVWDGVVQLLQKRKFSASSRLHGVSRLPL